MEKKFLSLSPEELDFLKAQTLIESEDALKEHIFDVQKKAYEVGNSFSPVYSNNYVT